MTVIMMSRMGLLVTFVLALMRKANGDDVCNGGFNPSVETYYTIYQAGTPGGYWAALTAGKEVEFTDDKSLTEARWRFIYISDGVYSVRNRATGFELTDEWTHDALTYPIGYRTKELDPTCLGNGAEAYLGVTVQSNNGPAYIREVKSYTILTAEGLTPRTVDNDNPRTAFEFSDLLAYAATLGSGAATLACGNPMCGAMLAVLFSLSTTVIDYLNGEDPTDVYVKLSNDILDIAQDMIDYNEASTSVTAAATTFQNNREWFMNEYKADKEDYIEANDLEELDELAGYLEYRAYDYYDNLDIYFGSDYTSNTYVNLIRGFIGFDILALATVEILSMYQESVFLNAYSNPEYSCSMYIENNYLQDKAMEFKYRLQNTTEMMTVWRKNNDEWSYHLNDQDWKAECTYEIGSYSSSCSGDGPILSDLLATFKEEIAADMAYLSYPITAHVGYFDNFVETTTQLCEAMRTDPTVRAAFKTDDADAEASYSNENGSCVLDMDCADDLYCGDDFVCHAPTSIPTASPSLSPTGNPTVSPTNLPTGIPSVSPTEYPTASPSELPTFPTWNAVSDAPSITLSPTKDESGKSNSSCKANTKKCTRNSDCCSNNCQGVMSVKFCMPSFGI